MKIRPEHYSYIRKAISAVSAADMAAHRVFIQNEGRSKDIEKRLRWDLSYRVGLSRWLCENVYSYADNSHIDTALKAVMRDLYGEASKSLLA